MKLVETLPWQESVLNAPPVKLIEQVGTVPEDVILRVIGTRHDADGGEPDYVSGVIGDTDVLFLEAPYWTNERAKRMQALANGEYSALKATLKRSGLEDGHASGAGIWLGHIHKQVFGSRVRYIPTDYPKNHPGLREATMYLNNASRLTEAGFRIMLKRDVFVADHLSSKIAELRKFVPTLRDKSPLRAMLLVGAGHYALGEAMATVAQQTGVNTFKAFIEFEESAAFDHSATLSPKKQAETREDLVNYQNWLRTPNS